MYTRSIMMFLVWLVFSCFCYADESRGAEKNVIWQIGKADNSDKEFIYQDTQDFARNERIGLSSNFNKETHEFIYKAAKKDDPHPDFPSSLANPYSLRWSRNMATRIRIKWNEETAGFRRLEIHTSDFDHRLPYRDALRLSLPGGNIKYWQLPDHHKGGKDLNLEASFAVKAGENELALEMAEYVSRHHIRFDWITLVSIPDMGENIKPVVEIPPGKTYNVFLEGEKIELGVNIFNMDKDLTLKWHITDFWDNEAAKGESIVTRSGNGTGRVAITPVIKKRGYFIFESFLVDSSGKEITLGMAENKVRAGFAVIVPQNRIIDTDKSPFAVWLDSDALSGLENYERFDQLAFLAKRAGFTWSGIKGLAAANTFPQKGVFKWDFIDRAIATLKKHNFRIMAQICGIPRWAARTSIEGKKPVIPGYWWDVPETNAWRSIVEGLFIRYKDDVEYWEIHNEPDNYPGSCYWGGNSYDYYESLKTAYEAAKGINPENKIILSLQNSAYKFHEEVFKYGGAKYFDVLGIHYVDSVKSRQHKLILNKYDVGDKPVWDTENQFGYQGVWDGPQFSAERKRTEAVIRACVYELSLGIDRIFFFIFDGMPKDKEQRCIHNARITDTGFVSWDLSPRPIYAAFSALMYRLEGAEFLCKSEIEKNVWSYVFMRDNDPIAVIWHAGAGAKEIEFSAGCPFVWVVDLMNNEKKTETENGMLKLTVSESPVYIHGMNNRLLLIQANLQLHKQSVLGAGTASKWQVEFKNPFARELRGTLQLTMPQDIRVEPEMISFSLKPGDKGIWPVDIVVPAKMAGEVKEDKFRTIVHIDGFDIPDLVMSHKVLISENMPGTNLFSADTFSAGEAENLRDWQTGMWGGAKWQAKTDDKGFGDCVEINLPDDMAKGTLMCRKKISAAPGIPEIRYSIGLWIKGAPGIRGQVLLYPFDKDGKEQPGQPGVDMKSVFEARDEWQYYGAVYDPPEGVASFKAGFVVTGAKGAVSIARPELMMLTEDPIIEAKHRWRDECRLASKKPKLTGDVSDWADAIPLYLDSEHQAQFSAGFLVGNGIWGGRQNLSGRIYTMWDQDNFYLMARVTDDFHCPVSISDSAVDPNIFKSRYYKWDSVQFVFDWKNKGGRSDCIYFGLYEVDGKPELRRDLIAITEAQYPMMYTGVVKEAKVAITRKGNETIYEVILPKACILPVTLEDGRSYGFSALINDNDGKGRRGWVEWSSGVGFEGGAKLFGQLMITK